MPFSFLATICREEESWNHREAEAEAKEVNSFNTAATEPTSVLHMRRSPTPSPPTSASTLSNDKKEDWANELQPIILSSTTGTATAAAIGAAAVGVVEEDWETMWPEPGGQEQSLLRWIAGGGEMDESLIKQLLLQTGNQNNNNNNNSSSSNTCVDFQGNANGGLGIVDQESVLDPIGNLIPGFPASGFNGNAKVDPNLSPLAGGANGGESCIQASVFSNLGVPVSLNSSLFYQQNQFLEEEKPQFVGNTQLLMSQNPPNPSFFMPLGYNSHHQENHVLQPPLKRHNSSGADSHVGIGFSMGFGGGNGMQFVPQHFHQQQQQQQQPLMVAKQPQKVLLSHGGEEMIQQQQQQQQQTLLDQLYKAAELVGTGNFSHAQGILARLNHQLSPVGKPLHRAAYYFKEALQLLLFINTNSHPAGATNPLLARTPTTPFDVIFKMGAYKVFSEISPLIQFVNFTCNQALLEALDSADRIHIVDFDIGFGAQWSSFIQELPLRSKGAPGLRITAVTSPSTHHPIELALMRENLTQFANEAGVSLELEVVNFEYLEQQTGYNNLPISRPNENEAIAVNFPVWCSSNQPIQLPLLLRFVKQLSPKIMVCLDRGCDRTDLPFPQHILHALQSYINLLESLDASNANSDAVNKIERFLLLPRIESTVLGRVRSLDKMPQWKTLFASAGFSPVTFSNFAETQADCLVKRAQTRGFHVEKRQTSLVLCWQHRELISASAWKC